MTITPEYIALCLYATLPRNFQAGDWYQFLPTTLREGRPGLELHQGGNQDLNEPMQAGERGIWIPSLGDLRELLEEAGAWWVRFDNNLMGLHGTRPDHTYSAECATVERLRWHAFGATVEEAALRLYLSLPSH